MPEVNYINAFLTNETASMLHRLKQLKPFSMTITMVKSAAVSDRAFAGVDSHLLDKKKKLVDSVHRFLKHLEENSAAEMADPAHLQNRFSTLKLRFNSILDQLDIYADVLTQRSEPETGTWLRGLDKLAEDGLVCGSKFYEIPPLMVYLDRGHGAAIRRARTRLPGGDSNPVAVIQIPRERMIGNGIASSLIHEAGHQGAALIGLTEALKSATDQTAVRKTKNKRAWAFFGRWVSEIVADFWAIAQLGVTATQGLMGVMTLPAYFQFRLDMDDPHPAPFVRVMLSCVTGQILFPDSQWERLEATWRSFYPVHQQPQQKQNDLQELFDEMPEFVRLMINLQLKTLGNRKLVELFPVNERQPEKLRAVFRAAMHDRSLFAQLKPVELFAVVGQARADRRISAQAESRLLEQQLINWANQ